MPGEQRLQERASLEQALPRLAIRRLAQPLALRVAEDVGKKHVGILAIGLEQQDVGVRILAAVFLHADLHARMDDRAKCLRQHQRQPALMDASRR